MYKNLPSCSRPLSDECSILQSGTSGKARNGRATRCCAPQRGLSRGAALRNIGGRCATEVRDPTDEEVAGFRQLSDLLTWAKIKGQLECPGSRAGALLRLVARGEWPECEIADFATVSPGAYDELLEHWLYCSEGSGDHLDDKHYREEFSDETPGAMLIGAAHALHHACRIKAKIVYTRQATDAYDQYMVQQSTANGQAAHAPIILHAPVAPVVETVNISQLLDTSKNRDVPVMPKEAVYKGI